MPYAVQLIGRLPDGRVEDSIKGVPILVNLPFREVFEHLKETLMSSFMETPNSEKSRKKDFGNKILPIFTSNVVKLIAYSIQDKLIVQFGHVEGTLDQYSFGTAIDPYRSLGQGGSMPQLIVNGALYPCAQKIALPGGLREAVVGRIPLLSRRSKMPEDVELFFFDPTDLLSSSPIQMTSLGEQEKSMLALLVEYVGNFVNVPTLLHEIQELKDEIRGWTKRAKGDKETIKKLSTELRTMRTLAGGARPTDPATYLLSMALTQFLWVFGGLAFGGILAFLLNVANNALAFGFMLVVGVLVGMAGGLMANYLRMAR